MVIAICPRCQRQYMVMDKSGDYIHNCAELNSNEVLANEDVPVIGNWTDDDGSTGTKPPQEVMRAGIENELFPSRAWVEGGDFNSVTSRGNRKATHRTKRHLEYIEKP